MLQSYIQGIATSLGISQDCGITGLRLNQGSYQYMVAAMRRDALPDGFDSCM